MKTKLISLSFLLTLALFPAVTFAAWWNPFTWGVFRRVEVRSATSTLNAVASTTQAYTPPPAEELLRRIAELENKLEKTRVEKKEVATLKSDNISAQPAAQTLTYSSSEISSKVKPAIVYAETATSSGSATIIDSQGHILIDAHTVWSTDSAGAVVGRADYVSVTLSNGTKKSAKLIGIDEANDIAVLQLPLGGNSYLKLNHDSGIQIGDKVYIVGTPSLNGGGTGGSSFVSGIVTKKTSNVIEINTDSKPLDNGGAVVTSKGDFIGIPNRSTCKVLEEMKNCLKYTVTTNIVKSVMPKLLLGMNLYKDKKYRTAEEELIRERLQWMYGNTYSDGSLEYTINSATGDNSFDYFNNRLGDDQDGKITKLYLFKLKQIATSINSAMESLSSRAHDLDVVFTDESANIDNLGDYQKKIIRTIQSDNVLKLKEYQAKVNIWSRKKNEYDSHIASPSGVTHDYLMTEGVIIEKEINYLKSERSRILNTFSGEAVNIF